jgi:hypothetical protein
MYNEDRQSKLLKYTVTQLDRTNCITKHHMRLKMKSQYPLEDTSSSAAAGALN